MPGKLQIKGAQRRRSNVAATEPQRNLAMVAKHFAAEAAVVPAQQQLGAVAVVCIKGLEAVDVHARLSQAHALPVAGQLQADQKIADPSSLDPDIDVEVQALKRGIITQ